MALMARKRSNTKRVGMRTLFIFSSPSETPRRMTAVAAITVKMCHGTMAPGVPEKAAHSASASRPGFMTPVRAYTK